MSWFALVVKPKHEARVAEQLSYKSLGVYVPKYSVRRQWSDRTKILTLPLFPRYVFCRFTFEDRLKVMSVPSVVSIVKFGRNPCPVSEDELAALKRIVDEVPPVTPWPFLRAGEHVCITKGPLCN